MSTPIGRIHHVGYLVKDIKKSITAFSSLGFSMRGDVMFDPDRNADICFMYPPAGEVVELVSPNKDSDIFPLLKKFNNAPYHICYEVEDLAHAIEYLKAKGFLLFKEPQRAMAISNSAQVAFLMHTRMGMIELVQL